MPRERVRDGLNGERYYAPGSTGKLQWGVGSWQQQRSADQTAVVGSASAPVVAANAAEMPAAAASRPAMGSYLLAVFDWFADVYHKSRYLFQY